MNPQNSYVLLVVLTILIIGVTLWDTLPSTQSNFLAGHAIRTTHSTANNFGVSVLSSRATTEAGRPISTSVSIRQSNPHGSPILAGTIFRLSCPNPPTSVNIHCNFEPGECTWSAGLREVSCGTITILSSYDTPGRTYPIEIVANNGTDTARTRYNVIIRALILSLTPTLPSNNLIRGSTISGTITATATSGAIPLGSPLSFRCSNIPGVTCTFSQTSCTSQYSCSARMNITADNTASLGRQNLQLDVSLGQVQGRSTRTSINVLQQQYRCSRTNPRSCQDQQSCERAGLSWCAERGYCLEVC